MFLLTEKHNFIKAHSASVRYLTRQIRKNDDKAPEDIMGYRFMDADNNEIEISNNNICRFPVVRCFLLKSRKCNVNAHQEEDGFQRFWRQKIEKTTISPSTTLPIGRKTTICITQRNRERSTFAAVDSD